MVPPSTIRDDYWGGEIRWMNSGELKLKLVSEVVGRISELGLKNSSTSILPTKCVLIGLAGQGKTRGTAAINLIELCVNQSIAAIYPSKSHIPEFLYYNLDNRYNELRNQSTGVGGRGGLNLGILKKIIIPLLSTLEEQEAIAEVLKDTDNLITVLTKLISKKNAMKQGTMQQLLTGKKRLLGFTRKWEVKKIGEILRYEQPPKYIVQNYSSEISFGIPVLTANKSFILGYSSEHNGIYKDIPVIIFDDFTTLSKYVTFHFKIKSSAIKLLQPRNEKINLRFVFERMQLIIFPIGNHKRYYISEYQHQEINIPSIDEQNAIVQILSDINEEIKSLENMRDKYKVIKQGIMQELLTGKTRLV